MRAGCDAPHVLQPRPEVMSAPFEQYVHIYTHQYTYMLYIYTLICIVEGLWADLKRAHRPPARGLEAVDRREEQKSNSSPLTRRFSLSVTITHTHTHTVAKVHLTPPVSGLGCVRARPQACAPTPALRSQGCRSARGFCTLGSAGSLGSLPTPSSFN